MRALRRESVDCTPIWMMRQAGRYMAEYREVRGKTTFLDLCRNPRQCAEVMLTAVERLGVDAAIIFADLLPILREMGLDLEFQPGEGPVIHRPLREVADIDRLREWEDPHAMEYVYETVRLTRAGLSETLPVIGFAGAPFTLASYAIEGGGSRNYLWTKKWMYTDSGAWNTILGRLSRAIGEYLICQIQAGAEIVQLFDSWAGCLSVRDYREYVLPYTQEVIRRVKEFSPQTPVIHFATGNPMLLPAIRDAGGDCIGVDWRVELRDAWEMIGDDRAIQGNLDPAVLLTDLATIRRHAWHVWKQAQGRKGHIFNLGHGIFKETPVENAVELVKMVHDFGSDGETFSQTVS